MYSVFGVVAGLGGVVAGGVVLGEVWAGGVVAFGVQLAGNALTKSRTAASGMNHLLLSLLNKFLFLLIYFITYLFLFLSFFVLLYSWTDTISLINSAAR